MRRESETLFRWLLVIYRFQKYFIFQYLYPAYRLRVPTMGGSGTNPNPDPSGVTAQGHGLGGDSIVLEEEIDPNYIPTQVYFVRKILHVK